MREFLRLNPGGVSLTELPELWQTSLSRPLPFRGLEDFKHHTLRNNFEDCSIYLENSELMTQLPKKLVEELHAHGVKVLFPCKVKRFCTPQISQICE